MSVVVAVVVALVALQHIAFLILEMFLWTKPTGLRIFRQSAERAAASRALAQNQGLYNGFLAAGLAWGLLHPDAGAARELQIFFLACVVVAGIFGAFTVNRRIFFVQAVPAMVGLGLLAYGL